MASSNPRIAPATKSNDASAPGSPTDTFQSSAQSGSSKRKSEVTSSSHKKRARVSYSCQECHRRKQKCDRQVPCGHCVARKVPELCKNYQPGKTEDFSARLARIEHIIELALPQYANADFTAPSSPGEPIGPSGPSTASYANGSNSFSNHHWNSDTLENASNEMHQSFDMDGSRHDPDRGRSVSSSPSGSNKEEEHEPSGGTLQSGQFFGTSALGSVNSRPILDPLQSSGSLPPMVDDNLGVIDKLESLIQDCGVPPQTLSELVNELPSRSMADSLINHYFSSVNYTRYKIYEPQFRASYENVWQNTIRVHPSDIRFLPLLFVVLAIAARLAPDHLISDSREKRLTSLRYYWSSRRALLIAAAVQTDSLELIIIRLLSARFLIFDRRITECWSQLGAAVRTAQALGMHRDPAKMPGLDAFQIDYRRRIWSYLYHADSHFALLLGRPRSVHDAYSDTHPPLNLEDNEILQYVHQHRFGPHNSVPSIPPPQPIQPHPLSIPTQATYTILRHTLAVIVGRIVHHFQQARHHSPYSEVLHLDEELQKFLINLPPHYSFLNPDTSLDSKSEFIPVHRFLIITEVFFTRISLHRPYILRKLNSDKFLPSRRACIESAKSDFEVRQAFKRTMPKTVIDSVGGAYREFQTAMISGIALVIDPHGSDAEAMHTILDTFLSHRGVGPNASPDSAQREWDDTTRREIKIIEFLNLKAKTVERKESMMAVDGPIMSDGADQEEDEVEGSRTVAEQQSAERSSFARRRSKANSTSSKSGPPGGNARANLTKLDLSGVAGWSSANLDGVVGSRINSPAMRTPPPTTPIPATTSPFLSSHSRTSSSIMVPRSGVVASPMGHTPVATPSPKFHPTNNPSIMSPSWVRAHPSSNLQRQVTGGNEGTSVAGSSPLGEDESAQRLLDNWCTNANEGFTGAFGGVDTTALFNPIAGTFGNPIGAAFGGAVPSTWPGGLTLIQPGMGLGLMNTLGPAGLDMSLLNGGLPNGMGGAGATLPSGELPGLPPIPGAEGGDWGYWETLVSEIRASGAMT